MQYFSEKSIFPKAVKDSIYRITAVLNVETDIITSMAASLTGGAMILVIMYVDIFKTGIIVFISDVNMCLISH